MGADDVTPTGRHHAGRDPVARQSRAFGDPDHYGIRFTGTDDDGGVHINSVIPGHAFYLAIEGGTNRISDLRVTGVGAVNREKIERVFFRAFTHMLRANATFSVARAATLQRRPRSLWRGQRRRTCRPTGVDGGMSPVTCARS